MKLSEGEMKEMVRQKLRWVMQDAEVVEEMMQRLKVYADERWGGFGKIKPDLVEWMKVEEEKGVLWDRVYSAKMGFALAHDGLRNAMGTEILVLHTGGLSGNRSLETISV